MVKSNYITITNLRTNTYKLLSASIDYYIDFDCRYDCIVCINFNRAINRCLIIFRKMFSMSPSDDGNLSITKFLCVCLLYVIFCVFVPGLTVIQPAIYPKPLCHVRTFFKL